jgi:hypothetical protein
MDDGGPGLATSTELMRWGADDRFAHSTNFAACGGWSAAIGFCRFLWLRNSGWPRQAFSPFLYGARRFCAARHAVALAAPARVRRIRSLLPHGVERPRRSAGPFFPRSDRAVAARLQILPGHSRLAPVDIVGVSRRGMCPTMALPGYFLGFPGRIYLPPAPVPDCAGRSGGV